MYKRQLLNGEDGTGSSPYYTMAAKADRQAMRIRAAFEAKGCAMLFDSPTNQQFPIFPNRLLAKMASDFEKPDRVHTLYKYEVETKMWPLPVGDLFGVGPSAAKRLNSCGIYTIGDLARLERDTAVKLFGSRGDTLWNYANGREADPVTKQRLSLIHI